MQSFFGPSLRLMSFQAGFFCLSTRQLCRHAKLISATPLQEALRSADIQYRTSKRMYDGFTQLLCAVRVEGDILFARQRAHEAK